MNQTLADEKNIARKAWQDSLQDGLIELSAGIGMLFLSLLLQYRTMGFVVLVAIFGPLLMKRLKERYTYPRVGYVTFPEKSQKQGLIMVLLMGVAVVVTALVIVLVGKAGEPHAWYRWTTFLPAILFQGAFLPVAVKSGIRRYYVISALVLLLGAGAALLELPGNMDNLWVYLMTIGAILTVWGAILLIIFLRKYPVQVEEAQNDE